MNEEILKPNNEVYLSRAINPHRLDAILKYAGESILDVGCGNGLYVLKINREHPKFKIHGVDYQSFDTWKESPELFTNADAFGLPFEDNSFDTITLFEVLEHLPDPVKALKEYYRVCRKNLILTVPNCEYPASMKQSLLTYFHYTDFTHVNFFRMHNLLDTVKSAGFKIHDSYYINKMNLIPFIEDTYNLKSGLAGKLIGKLLSKRKAKEYHITCLVVAEKKH
jgi:ubiquinone/menaquinone biosynthesis C-methylase UbiE